MESSICTTHIQNLKTNESEKRHRKIGREGEREIDIEKRERMSEAILNLAKFPPNGIVV